MTSRTRLLQKIKNDPEVLQKIIDKQIREMMKKDFKQEKIDTKELVSQVLQKIEDKPERIRVEKRIEEITFHTWKPSKENTFNLKQAKLRSETRIAEGREKNVDILTIIQRLYNKNTTIANPKIPTNYLDFLKFLSSIRIDEYADLLVDINLHRQFEGEGEYVQFWDCAEALVILYIDISKNSINKSKDEFDIYKEGIDESVEDDTKKMLLSKSFEELVQFEQKTKQKLANLNLETEMSFWETMLKRIVVLKVIIK